MSSWREIALDGGYIAETTMWEAFHLVEKTSEGDDIAKD